MMCHSLYVKANGEIPCWDDVGEEKILFNIGAAANTAPIKKLFHHEELIRIRENFGKGILPHSTLCGSCAVNGCGKAEELRPKSMDVLHLESSFLCHLSCPQCIPAKDRRSLKEPPYHMTPELLENLLETLSSEGVSEIKFVHFEGRGDPLLNPELESLVKLVRAYYPGSVIGATTHGSYEFQDWLTQGDLDLLRVSIDGAFSESYSTYRIGGDFAKVSRFLTSLSKHKAAQRSRLQIEWKYILFSWNDSDAEIKKASNIAHELDIGLCFVITHTPGRSQRYQIIEVAEEQLQILAPGSRIEKTFQLKNPAERKIDVDSLLSEHVTSLLMLAHQCVLEGDGSNASRHLASALVRDSGISEESTYSSCHDLLLSSVDTVLERTRFPATCSWMAGLFREFGDIKNSNRLLRRYLELAPNAPDSVHVTNDLNKLTPWHEKIRLKLEANTN